MELCELHRLPDSALQERAEVFLEHVPKCPDTLSRGMRKCRRALIAALRKRTGMECVLQRLGAHAPKRHTQ